MRDRGWGIWLGPVLGGGAAALALAAAVAVGATATPGGRFAERLRQARARQATAPPRAPRAAARRAPTHTRPPAKRSQALNARRPPRPLPRGYRPVRGVLSEEPVLAPLPVRRAPAVKAAAPSAPVPVPEITHTFGPRPPGAPHPDDTGDVLFNTVPPGLEVEYRTPLGITLSDSGLPLQGLKPGDFAVTIVIPALKVSIDRVIPIHAGQMTEVVLVISRPARP